MHFRAPPVGGVGVEVEHAADVAVRGGDTVEVFREEQLAVGLCLDGGCRCQLCILDDILCPFDRMPGEGERGVALHDGVEQLRGGQLAAVGRSLHIDEVGVGREDTVRATAHAVAVELAGLEIIDGHLQYRRVDGVDQFALLGEERRCPPAGVVGIGAKDAVDLSDIFFGAVACVPAGGEGVGGDGSSGQGGGRLAAPFHVVAGDDAILLLDVGDGFAEGQVLVGERGGRRVVGELGVARAAGVEVAGPAAGALRAAAVGGDDGHALDVAVVDGVLLPCRGFVIDVGDEQSVAVGAAVPSLLLDVLDDEVLVGVLGGDDAVGFASVGGGEQGELLFGVDGLDVHPVEELLFVGGIAGGGVAVFVIAAVVHDAPDAHAEVLGVVGRVVEVGQAEAVAELVADGADAVERGAAVAMQLVAAGISVDLDAVELQRRSRGVGQRPLMGPDGVDAAALSFAIAGVDDVAEVDDAVAIGVVVLEVDVLVALLQHLGDEVAGMFVIALAVVAAVVLHLLRGRVGAIDVELRGELAA